MKKLFKILGIIILCLAVAAGAVAYWQRDHIKALINGLRYSGEELDNMMTNAQSELKNAVESFSGTELRDYTEEEQQQIESGEVSSDEVMAKIINEAVEQKLAQSAQNNTSSGNTPAEKTVDTIINEHVSKLYSLKSNFMGQVDSLLAQAAAEYYSMADGGAYGKETKQVLIPKYIGLISGLESTCDKEVEAVISSLTAELKARGESLDIIKTIRSAYAHEKSLKIAQIINEYG